MFNQENFIPDRKNLHRHPLWCLWQIWYLLQTMYVEKILCLLRCKIVSFNYKMCLPTTFFWLCKSISYQIYQPIWIGGGHWHWQVIFFQDLTKHKLLFGSAGKLINTNHALNTSLFPWMPISLQTFNLPPTEGFCDWGFIKPSSMWQRQIYRIYVTNKLKCLKLEEKKLYSNYNSINLIPISQFCAIFNILSHRSGRNGCKVLEPTPQ